MKMNARRLLGVLGIFALATWSLDCKSEDQSKPVAAPMIEISRAVSPGIRREITLDDMVSLREVREPRQSPDGRKVAFLVKQAFRQCDCYRTALYVTSSQRESPAQKLAEEDYIANLQWLPDGRFVSYLSSKDGSVQLWRMNLATHRADRVFGHTPNRDRSTERAMGQSHYMPASGVVDYRWSPDGERVAFTAEAPADPSLTAAVVKEGFRYDDATMSAWDLMIGDWALGHRSKQLWLYDLGEKREHLVWSATHEWSAAVSALLWSPSGRKLAFMYSTNGGAGSDVMGMLDVLTMTVSEEGTPGGDLSYSEGAAWSPDEREIAYLARAEIASSYTLEISNVVDHSRREVARGISPGHYSWLAWNAEKHQILFVSEGLGQDRRQTGLYSIADGGGTPVRLTSLDIRVSDCDAIVKNKVVCAQQSPSVSPRPAVVSISDGGIQSLGGVNPELRSIEFGPVRELHWNNKFGDATNGFLVLPTHTTPGVRLPLVVVGYAFSGEFVAQANSVLTTYPAQALARDGIAVLLFNYPRYSEWKGPNFERGSRALGYGPLASIQAIIEQLDAEGLIDKERVGMMGHSMAGFWVQFGISHTDMFKVVEMHNGGSSSEPGTYWGSGLKQLRELQERVMGGPPYGDTLKNYQEFSMTLNASRIRTPVLMEYDAMEAVDAMEYYEAMQHYQVPVDFFVYPNDGHVTERPEHRFMSLQRNLDWFEFWLLGKENDASSKGDQYARWRKLRVQAEKYADDGAGAREGH